MVFPEQEDRGEQGATAQAFGTNAGT